MSFWATGWDNVFGWGLIQMSVECVRVAAKVVQEKSKREKQIK